MILNNLFTGLSESNLYFEPWIRREEKSGGRIKMRPMVRQSPEMKVLHQRLTGNLRRLNLNRESSWGGVAGRNRYLSIAMHRRFDGRGKTRQRAPYWFYAVDIQSAYPSVDLEMLAEALHTLDPSESTETLLTFLKTYCVLEAGELLQGTSSSVELFNLFAAFYVDDPLRKLCLQHDLWYSRFIDDMLFSTDRGVGVGSNISGHIRRVMRDAKLTIGEHKTVRCDMRAVEYFNVSGYVMNRAGNISLGRDYLNETCFMLREVLREPCAHTAATIRGKMGPIIHLRKNGNSLNSLSRKALELYRRYRHTLPERPRP